LPKNDDHVLEDFVWCRHVIFCYIFCFRMAICFTSSRLYR